MELLFESGGGGHPGSDGAPPGQGFYGIKAKATGHAARANPAVSSLEIQWLLLKHS